MNNAALFPANVPVVTPQVARTLIQDADLFALGGHADNPIDDAIRAVTQSWITHCGMFVRKSGDSVFTLESTFEDGVHAGGAASYLEGGDGPLLICRLKGMTPVAAANLIARGQALIGKKYEVGEEVEMALHRLCALVPVHPEYKRLFCSGFLQDVLRGSPWQLANDASGGNATPADVYAEPFVVPVCGVRV